MASTTKLNYNHKGLASVINYNRTCDITILSILKIVIYDHKTFTVLTRELSLTFPFYLRQTNLNNDIKIIASHFVKELAHFL
jgi:hypothetical protein